MAFSGVTERGSTNNKTSAGSIAGSPSDNVAVDRICFSVLSFNNIATTTGASTTQDTFTDTDGHTWNKVYEFTDAGTGAADAGVSGSLWWTKVTSQIGTGDTLTAAFDANVTAKVLGFFEVTIGAGNTIQVAAQSQAERGSSTPAAITISGLANKEYLALGIYHREQADVTWTEDADYTNVFAAEGIGTSGGGAATNVVAHVGYRIFTGTGDTFQPAFAQSTDAFVSFVFFEEVASGTNYDETGRALTITATIAGTEQLTLGELNRLVSVAATVTGTDQADFVDNKTISIAATIAGTDVAAFVQNLALAIAATITGTDGLAFDESGRQVSVSATITETDTANFLDALNVAITATLAGTDTQAMTEAGRLLSIAATITATDGLRYEDAVAMTILATITATDELGAGGGGFTPNSWELLGILKEMCEARGLTPGDLLAALNRLAGTTAKDAVAALQAMGATSGEIVGAINELAATVDDKELIGALRAWAESGNF